MHNKMLLLFLRKIIARNIFKTKRSGFMQTVIAVNQQQMIFGKLGNHQRLCQIGGHGPGVTDSGIIMVSQ